MFGIFLPPDMPFGIVAEAILLVGSCFLLFEAGLLVRRWQRKRRQKRPPRRSESGASIPKSRETAGTGVAAPSGGGSSWWKYWWRWRIFRSVPVRGYIINRSHGGLLLGLAESVAVGEILKVRPPPGSGGCRVDRGEGVVLLAAEEKILARWCSVRR